MILPRINFLFCHQIPPIPFISSSSTCIFFSPQIPMVTVTDDTALGSAKETACRIVGKNPVERSTNDRLKGCEKSCKNGFSKKPYKDKSSLCDGIGAAMVESRVSWGEGELAMLSSWFCVCAGWWWKLMSLCYTVEPVLSKGQWSAGAMTYGWEKMKDSLWRWTLSAWCKDVLVSVRRWEFMESVRLLPSTLLSWEAVLGKGHSGGTNS